MPLRWSQSVGRRHRCALILSASARIALIVSITAAAVSLVSPSAAAGLTIEIMPACELDASCTAASFFTAHPEALATLQLAAKAFEPLADQLVAIPASPATTLYFTHPDSGASSASVSNFEVPANTVMLMVGGRNFAGNQVAEAGPGGPLAMFARGQGTITGPTASDFAMWGGSVAFDTITPFGSWHFGIDTLPAPGQIDFLSVATHELAHVFGFLDAVDSFSNLVVGHQFLGATSVALYGDSVPLHTDDLHWADGVTSPPYANEPETALDRAVVGGRRTLLTPLDYAALADIGWEVPDQLLGLHGNTDGDADVDGADFLAWQRGFGSAGVGALSGDTSGDTIVDDYDQRLWRQHFGATAAGGPPSSTVVPEPTSATILVGVIALALEASRRRRIAISLKHHRCHHRRADGRGGDVAHHAKCPMHHGHQHRRQWTGAHAH